MAAGAAKLKIAVLVSGGGSNLQALLDACASGGIAGEIVAVLSSTEKAYALTRSEKAGVPGYVLSAKEMGGAEKRNKELLRILKQLDPGLIVLAGYLGIIPPEIVAAFRGRIINIHPALLPKFGGQGMFGIRVHEAVIAAGEKESGATVHFVDEGTDTGGIILQESLPVLPGDTPETLQKRILEKIEHPLLVRAVRMIAEQRQK